jgi:hypothetical protein
MNHTLVGMTAGYIAEICFFSFAVILQVFAALRSELLTYFQKPCKSTAKTKHHVGIIKSAVFPNSFPFLLDQNQKRIKQKSEKN